ncbi:hypothetical protein K450DRAFT_262951 [Umbelopsis ramanniana AG]|uniref:RWD domain-containing protein n=1 Tax=Umbelopsis ramanniana AG TaxID=1314678 RepID=A0AAD5DZ59_UMBRA|nr:uncharacterized protein K450DRAFT_262951 [Umbelopsis ramanniana AG]KAI8575188.1 hypothetical protein K450DRAFT_262951 [Umbelopsis ramanniana AG]
MSADRQAQEEEALVLESIYDQDFKINEAAPDTYHFTLRLDEEASDNLRSPRLVVIDFHIPEAYPSSTMPVYEITSVYCGTQKIDASVREEIDTNFKTMFVPGEVVLFEWINWLKEYLDATYPEEEQQQQEVQQPEDMETTNDVDDSTTSKIDSSLDDECPEIKSGESLIDRKSVFVGHVATVNSVEQVQAVRRKLLQNKKIAKATHNILAYRIELDSGVIAQDHDEDGETAAGGRLLHLLQILDVTNVVVIVSRWYGGIHLHADRFKDINNSARQVLETYGYIDDTKGKKK